MEPCISLFCVFVLELQGKLHESLILIDHGSFRCVTTHNDKIQPVADFREEGGVYTVWIYPIRDKGEARCSVPLPDEYQHVQKEKTLRQHKPVNRDHWGYKVYEMVRWGV